ncbi:endonuclease/exonuclease/phosphatase family protein [Primorskyibacter sp. 2E107]|uniref:endonuclease/exonuclease/phosphatase family protein n=1 Tax=Primorskyibacter sp. 2E107 TaxID=3403458 RepID=UPI003AF4E58E
MGVFLRVIAAALGLALLAGFAGALHPAGDSLAVFRVPLLVLLALAVLWSDLTRRLRWPLVALALAGLAPHLPMPKQTPPAAHPGDLTIVQQNLLWNRTEWDDWLEMITRIPPDVLLLQEVSSANLVMLDRLAELYPYRLHCPAFQVGEAVLTRLPPVAGRALCSKPDGIAALQVETSAGPVWMVSLHIPWPWPYPQAEQVTGILPDLRRLDGPVVLGGDFNSVGWSHTLRRIEAATGSRRIGPYTHTFSLPYLGLPIGIDHILAPPGSGFDLRVTPRLGSDHRGQWVRLQLPN